MRTILNRAAAALGLAVALWAGHCQAVIVSVSKPPNSDDADCLPLRDGVYQVAVPPYPLNVGLGIGNIVNPVEPGTYGDFVIHDHQYVAPHIPDPARSVVTYRFHTPTVVAGLEIAQHANGITAVEGFVGDDPGALGSMGTVFGPRGDITGSSVFAEFERNVFAFTNAQPGLFFRFVIRKTSLAEGLALYRAFPLDPAGSHIPVAQAEVIVTTDPTPLTENSGIASIRVQRLRDTDQAATISFAVSGGTAMQGVDYFLTNGTLDFAAGVTNLTIPLTIVDDGLREGPETILLGFTNAASGWSTQVPFTIQDNDLATLHVWQDSPNPTPPHLTWATAATNIQDAVDAALPGETLLVTNGVYATGEREAWVLDPMQGLVSVGLSRVVVTNAIRLESVNGPLVTTIMGGQLTNEVGEVTNQMRCVFLGANAALSGFTLTNGAAGAGGGVRCESASAVVSNCVITGNSAVGWPAQGGGAYGGTLNNCTLTGNLGWQGGGASLATLNNSTLADNSARGCGLKSCGEGGGAFESTLSNCVLIGNRAISGGGAFGGTLNNCVLSGNFGGGVSGGTLHTCLVSGNEGGSGGEFYNCTVVGNNAGVSGVAFNSILYYNTGANYEPGTSLDYCCTTPMPTNGVGNIATDPQLASATHLSTTSPCIGAGSPSYATGVDIDGEPWANPPCIGADQLTPGSATGGITVRISTDYGNVNVGFVVSLVAEVQGRLVASVWDFGDGTGATNRPYASHAWDSPGAYTVRLTCYNDSHPEGVSATRTIQVRAQDAAVLCYVNQANPNPVFPYTSWATAARTIQEAIDTVAPGSARGVVLVTNGIYATGGRVVAGSAIMNRVAVDKPLALRSVNGPQFTIIRGGQALGGGNGDGAVRCVYLTEGASLVGFTLTTGATRTDVWTAWPYLETSGGGVWCEQPFSTVVSNCVITGNSASSAGGGAYGGIFYNCTLTGNSASYGGGALGATLYNCTVKGNSAWGGRRGQRRRMGVIRLHAHQLHANR